MDYQTIPLPNPFIIEIEESALKTYPKQKVEEIWAREKRVRGEMLHDGKILVFNRFENNKLIASFIDYRIFFAQICDPEIAKELNLCSLGVSGITLSGDRVLIGRRSKTVAHYPHYYELAPSGGIDPSAIENGKINPERQARLELEEETGIEASNVLSAKSRFLIRDKSINTLEICIEIQVNPLLGLQNIKPTFEYEELFWLHKDQVMHFFEQKRKETIPFSLVFFSGI